MLDLRYFGAFSVQEVSSAFELSVPLHCHQSVGEIVQAQRQLQMPVRIQPPLEIDRFPQRPLGVGEPALPEIQRRQVRQRLRRRRVQGLVSR